MFVYKKEKKPLKSLGGISKAKLKCTVNKVNCVLKKINIRKLTEQNNTMYGAATYISEFRRVFTISQKRQWTK